MSIAQDITTLDPTQMTYNEDIWMSEQLYETLYVANPAGTKLEPKLATSYTLSADKKTWTFQLRHDVHFADGKPMTSADVVFSINQARAKTSFWAALDAAITTVSAAGPYTVVITTRYPWAPLLSDLALFGNGVVPDKYGGLSRSAFFKHPIGTGPFEFAGRKTGQYVKAVRNTHYWQPGRPYLSGVTWTVVPDANTRVLQVEGGQSDIGEFPPWSAVNSLRSNPAVAVDTFPSSRTDYLAFNVRAKPFDDAHVRRAVAYALDRKAMVKVVLFGNGQVANALLTPALWGYDADLEATPFDLTQARAEMAQSTVKSGFATTLTIAPGDPAQVALSQLVQAALKPLGIAVTIRNDASENADVAAGHYDMTFQYDTTDIIDPDELINFSVNSKGGQQALYTGYANPKVDSLILQAERVFSQSQRKALYAQIQSIVANDAPLIPLYYSPYVYVRSKKVQGFSVYTIGYYPLSDVYIAP